jgi:hypothetical protein
VSGATIRSRETTSMLRALFFAVFLLFVGQVSGAMAALTASDDCGETCPDEERERSCPPTCTHCACGLQLAIEMPAPRFVPTWPPPEVAPDEERPLPFAATGPPSPDPREILRVPR